MINRNGRDGEGYQLVQLIPASGSGEVIELRYQKVAATYSGLCASTAQHLRGIVQDLEIGGFFFDDRTIAEDFNAGTVSTVLSTNNFRYPNIDMLSSIVCSDENMADVIYAYDHNPVKSTGPRDMVMSTLTLRPTRSDATSMLLGRWDGQANTLTFFAIRAALWHIPNCGSAFVAAVAAADGAERGLRLFRQG